MKDLYMFR